MAEFLGVFLAALLVVCSAAAQQYVSIEDRSADVEQAWEKFLVIL